MTRSHEQRRVLLSREHQVVKVRDSVHEGRANGAPVFQVRYRIRYEDPWDGWVSTSGATVETPWMAGIPSWFFQPEEVAP